MPTNVFNLQRKLWRRGVNFCNGHRILERRRLQLHRNMPRSNFHGRSLRRQVRRWFDHNRPWIFRFETIRFRLQCRRSTTRQRRMTLSRRLRCRARVSLRPRRCRPFLCRHNRSKVWERRSQWTRRNKVWGQRSRCLHSVVTPVLLHRARMEWLSNHRRRHRWHLHTRAHPIPVIPRRRNSNNRSLRTWTLVMQVGPGTLRQTKVSGDKPDPTCRQSIRTRWSFRRKSPCRSSCGSSSPWLSVLRSWRL